MQSRRVHGPPQKSSCSKFSLNLAPISIITFFQAYIICSILLFALPQFIPDYHSSVKLPALPTLLPITHVALVGSIYSTVALALERYITVCHPFVRYRYEGNIVYVTVMVWFGYD